MKPTKRLKDFMMLSCKKASALIDKKFLFGLTRKEKVILKMHTAFCHACTAYEKQSKLIDKILHTHIHSHSETNLPVISNKELQKLIISKL